MVGSCQAPSTSTVWSGFWPHPTTPQQLADWQDVAAPGLICGKDLMLGDQSVNCYSFLCQRAGNINGVPVADCTCPIGETFDGTQIPPDTAFFTQAGQCDVNYCSQHPVSDPIGFDDLEKSGECFRWPPDNNLLSDPLRDKLAGNLWRNGGGKKAGSSSSAYPTSGR